MSRRGSRSANHSEAVVPPTYGLVCHAQVPHAPAGLPLRPGFVLCSSSRLWFQRPGCPHTHASLFGLPRQSSWNYRFVTKLVIGQFLDDLGPPGQFGSPYTFIFSNLKFFPCCSFRFAKLMDAAL